MQDIPKECNLCLDFVSSLQRQMSKENLINDFMKVDKNAIIPIGSTKNHLLSQVSKIRHQIDDQKALVAALCSRLEKELEILAEIESSEEEIDTGLRAVTDVGYVYRRGVFSGYVWGAVAIGLGVCAGLCVYSEFIKRCRLPTLRTGRAITKKIMPEPKPEIPKFSEPKFTDACDSGIFTLRVPLGYKKMLKELQDEGKSFTCKISVKSCKGILEEVKTKGKGTPTTRDVIADVFDKIFEGFRNYTPVIFDAMHNIATDAKTQVVHYTPKMISLLQSVLRNITGRL